MFFQYFTKDTEKTKIKKFEDEQLNEKELNNFLIENKQFIIEYIDCLMNNQLKDKDTKELFLNVLSNIKTTKKEAEEILKKIDNTTNNDNDFIENMDIHMYKTLQFSNTTKKSKKETILSLFKQDN